MTLSKSISDSFKSLVYILTFVALLATGSAIFIACGGDDDSSTNGEEIPSRISKIANCSAEALGVFSEYLNYLTYIPPKIAGVREVPVSVEYYPADPADSLYPADSGTYRYYLYTDNDTIKDYHVEGRFIPADSNWDGGLYQGDVMIFRNKTRRTMYIRDTTMIGWISLVMLTHDTYRLTLANETKYWGQSACNCEITSLSVSTDMSNHDADNFMIPFGYLEFIADTYEGRFNGLLTIPSTGSAGTVTGTIGTDTCTFTLDLLTFEATY